MRAWIGLLEMMGEEELTRDERRIIEFLASEGFVAGEEEEEPADWPQQQTELLQQMGQRDRPAVELARADTMEGVVNLFSDARIAEQATASEVTDPFVLVDASGQSVDCAICRDQV
jgi:hypothetical protein